MLAKYHKSLRYDGVCCCFPNLWFVATPRVSYYRSSSHLGELPKLFDVYISAAALLLYLEGNYCVQAHSAGIAHLTHIQVWKRHHPSCIPLGGGGLFSRVFYDALTHAGLSLRARNSLLHYSKRELFLTHESWMCSARQTPPQLHRYALWIHDISTTDFSHAVYFSDTNAA